MQKLFFYVLIGFVFISCGEQADEKTKTEEEKSTVIKKDSIQIEEEYLGAEGFSPFQNIEQIEYTIFLPLTFYNSNHDSCTTRGQHIFFRPNLPNDYIEVKGMFRSDETIGIEEYFNNSFTMEDEESGKIITEKKLMVEDSAFYAIGYWSNFPERKFLEITWFGKESVVQLYVNDFGADYQPFWKSKIEFLLKKGVTFKKNHKNLEISLSRQ